MVIDRLNEEAIELTSAVGPAKDWFSDHSKKKNAPNCACHLCSGAMPLKKKTLCTALTERQGHASPVCHLAPRPCPSLYRSSLPALLDLCRNRHAECHLESRDIPADDSHTLPFFEEFLQSLQPQGGPHLNLAHRHPITPVFNHPARIWHRRRCPTTHHHSPRHPRSSPTWTLTCQHLPCLRHVSGSWRCAGASRSHVNDYCGRRCIGSGRHMLGGETWSATGAGTCTRRRALVHIGHDGRWCNKGHCWCLHDVLDHGRWCNIGHDGRWCNKGHCWCWRDVLDNGHSLELVL